MSLVLMSYSGMFLLLISALTKHKLSFVFFICGLGLMCFITLSFYPFLHDLQRENYLNPQSLFVFSSALLTGLKILEYYSFRKKKPGQIKVVSQKSKYN